MKRIFQLWDANLIKGRAFVSSELAAVDASERFREPPPQRQARCSSLFDSCDARAATALSGSAGYLEGLGDGTRAGIGPIAILAGRD
jgi:hypothetical protein